MLVAYTQLSPRREEIAPLGFLGHESYLPWLEVGRADLLKAQGIEYRKIELGGKYLPVLEWYMRFRRPVVEGDSIRLVTTLRTRPGLKFKIEYQMVRGRDVVAVGYTWQGFVNRNGWPCRPPDDFSAMIEREFAAEPRADSL